AVPHENPHASGIQGGRKSKRVVIVDGDGKRDKAVSAEGTLSVGDARDDGAIEGKDSFTIATGDDAVVVEGRERTTLLQDCRSPRGQAIRRDEAIIVDAQRQSGAP